MLGLSRSMSVQILKEFAGVPTLTQKPRFSYNIFPIENFWTFLHTCLWVSLGYLLIPHLPIFFLWGSKSRKLIFLGGFDPLDIRAQQGFFSQNARLVKEYVCANFERIRRGTLIDPKPWFPYNFFPIETFWFCFAHLFLGFVGLSFDTPFAYINFFEGVKVEN